MKIKPGDLVLEIGSGNNPNPRSDILCDRYVHDNGERAGEFDIVIDRPFVVADGYRLPFADKTFDYVICSHIVEHMGDPKAFLAEVTRVAKAGYIDVPSAASERVFGWDIHHWYCGKKGNALVLQRKTEGEQFGGFFHRLVADQIWFRRFFEEHESEWYVQFEWEGTILLRVMRPMSQDEIHALDERAWKRLRSAKPELLKDIQFFIAWMRRRIQRKLRKEIKRSYWAFLRTVFPGKIVARLLPQIVCPACQGVLHGNDHGIVCSSCRTRYLVEQGVPILLAPNEVRKGY